jgi:hypothetical protein
LAVLMFEAGEKLYSTRRSRNRKINVSVSELG